MLQERLGASLAELGFPVRRQIEIICGTLRRGWAVSPDPRFPSGSEKARSLAEFIAAAWSECNQPCSERTIERALSFANTREAAFDPGHCVLVHGDAHAANTLVASRSRAPVGARFKFVDPDGLFAERACDLAVPMRGWSGELLAGDTVRLGRERCAHLSQLTGVDAQSIWEWGFIERVSTGLLALRVGREDLGRETLAVAELRLPLRLGSSRVESGRSARHAGVRALARHARGLAVRPSVAPDGVVWFRLREDLDGAASAA